MCQDTITATAAVASSVVILVLAVVVAVGAWTVGKLPNVAALPPKDEPKVQSESAAVYFIEDNTGPPSMNAGVVDLQDPYAADTDDHDHENEDDQTSLVGR
jgi:hypothetical protein